ncbi:putative carbonic anhydrase-like protein 2 [Leptotrombidium deliense]|uniref:Putative carbonic anhydrase-like protein 2 n=1 Tax=Leptotrombidium deliense TaxID=299467 RepID=A0A443SVZ5_9ACAR|nr:putative carbonic anhydrase-like protein 2 [Leptotrombidium deliense]
MQVKLREKVMVRQAIKSFLRRINHLQKKVNSRQSVAINSFSIHDLVPDFETYLTYEGSMTIPQCSETVTWIIINKPIFITRAQLYSLRKLMQGANDSPKAPLANNFRPTKAVNHRVIRTNIDFQRKQVTCVR